VGAIGLEDAHSSLPVHNVQPTATRYHLVRKKWRNGFKDAKTLSAVGEAVSEGVERSLARQHALVANAKLVTTFIAGIAAALDASALQALAGNRLTTASSWRLATASSWLLALAVLLVVGVMLADRLKDANYNNIIADCAAQNLTDIETVNKLRTESLRAVENNESVISLVKSIVIAQVLTAILSGVLAALSMLVIRA
jgi:hypothetical protein